MMPKHVISLLALTMWWFLPCLFVALAASESTNYEPTLNPQKTYEYEYEGMVNIGRGIPDLAESGVKLRCNFQITGVSIQTFLLQISTVTFEEFNGIPNQNVFKISPSLTTRLAADLSKPFMFEYTKGQVVDIKTASDVPNTIVNIVRGILSFLHVTVKTIQHTYELDEVGIHGVCHSAYMLEENPEAKELYVTQNIDISKCKPKAERYSGMALMEETQFSKEKGQNIAATMKYLYTIKSYGNGGLITKASAHERHFFSPLNVKGGNFKLNALWNIELLKETDISGKPLIGQVKSRGNLMYTAEKGLGPMPILMIDLTNPVPKITNLIKSLAQANINQINSARSFEVLNLIQLLRASMYEDLELLWKQLSGTDEHRRWFLDTVVEVTDDRVLRFLRNRLKAGDITTNEAGQALLVAFNHLSAEPELVDIAKEFLTIPFSKSHPLLWNTVVLSYGSLIYRLCARLNPCPITTVQPLIDMVTNGLAKSSDEDMVLALKALGNAGHPSSLKTIMKFLPGFSVKANSLSARVQIVAVQSLRHLAIRDPHNVQDIALTIFAQRTASAQVRMLASSILLETKPPVALISALTELLLQETDLQVASFVYSQLRAISMSRTPENQHLSTSCNIAVKILSKKFGRLSYRFSKALRFDWFNDDFLMGTSNEFYLLRNGTSRIPTEIISSGKLYFIGRMLKLFELGVRAEGIKELFTDIPGISKDFGATDFAAIMKILSDWQSKDKDEPLVSLYARLFGQEISFIDLNQGIVQKLVKSFSFSASKENNVWNVIQQIQKGLMWHWTKPYLLVETRFIQPTCLGLPVEISKYFSSLAAISVNAKASMNPPPKEKLQEILNADISMETEGFVGATMDYFVYYGINTEVFQSGAQLSGKTIMSLPWKISLKKNVKEKNMEIIFPPCKKETELFKVRSDVYAVSRNIENPLSAKMSPIIPELSNTEEGLSAIRKDTKSSKEYQFEESEIYHPKQKYCAGTTIYGTTICTELEAKRIHKPKDYPLNYFLGFTQFVCQLTPVKTIKPVEKIKIQINAVPHKHISTNTKMNLEMFEVANVSKIMTGLGKLRGSDPTPDPVITVNALALSSNAKPLGYEAAAYYTPGSQKDDVELIISEVAEEANWKICVDANLDKTQTAAKAHFKWGAECQSYEVAVKFSATGVTRSTATLSAEMNWGEVPAFIQMMAKSVREYLPGLSYAWGFNQKHEKNSEQEVSATLLASAHEGFDLKVKVPELTVHRQGIPSPLEIVGIEMTEDSV